MPDTWREYQEKKGAEPLYDSWREYQESKGVVYEEPIEEPPEEIEEPIEEPPREGYERPPVERIDPGTRIEQIQTTQERIAFAKEKTAELRERLPRGYVAEEPFIRSGTDKIEVTYELPSGEHKTETWRYMDYKHKSERITERGGHIYRVQYFDPHRRHLPEGERGQLLFETETTEAYKKRQMEYIRRQYDRQQQLLLEKSTGGKMPYWYYPKYVSTQMIKAVKQPPSEISYLGLEKDYAEYIYKQLRGYPTHVKPPKDFVGPPAPYFQVLYQKTFERQPEYKKLEFAKKFYGYKEPEAEEPSFWDQLFGYIWMPHEQRSSAILQQLFGSVPKHYEDDPFHQAIRESGLQYKTLIKKHEWGTVGLGMAGSTPVIMGAAYVGGKAYGILKESKFGQKTIAPVGFIEEPLGSGIYKYPIDITPSSIVGGSVFLYTGVSTAISGYEAHQKDMLKQWLSGMALTMPFIAGFFKYGYRSGLGWMQRRGAMSKLIGLDRTRQQALYDSMDQVYRMGEYSYQRKPFKLTDIQRVDANIGAKVTGYYKTIRGRYLTRFGGSSSTYAQMPRGSFRTPRDIDLLIHDIFRGLKKAKGLRQPHVVDIHPYKPKGYYGFGKSLLPSTKIYIQDIGRVKGLPLREQFMRKTISILPSEKPSTGYRWFKDIPDWQEIGTVLSFQKGGLQLQTFMDKYLHPGKYPIPKVTFGERIIKRIGGAVEPTGWVETHKGFFIEPYYPKGIYYTPPVIYPLTISYPTPKYPTPKVSILKYPIPDYPTPKYPISSYPPIKPPVYPPSIPPIKTPSYTLSPLQIKPPPIKPPDYPSYPPSPPPSYPPSLPPSYPPSPPYEYPPSPPVHPPTRPPKIKKPAAGKRVIPVERKQGYHVWVKDRFIVGGKKVYEERFVKLTRNPLTKHQALGFGGTIVNQSAAASFYIKPTSGKVGKPSINITPWSFINNLFYKRNNIYIERTAHRINTPGEIREISARGWVAERRKMKPRPLKIFDRKKMKVFKIKDMREILKGMKI